MLLTKCANCGQRLTPSATYCGGCKSNEPFSIPGANKRGKKVFHYFIIAVAAVAFFCVIEIGVLRPDLIQSLF